MSSEAERLRQISTFEDLIEYLEYELDWPLQEYGFDELTFEYTPEELGLREEEIAKIRSIHQLRPIHDQQPWGIFFIEFDRKRLPVVAMRRILNRLVIKKRSSANSSVRARWEMSDLLFISSFGEEDKRQLSFAHFHEDKETEDLPTLHVLGWDGENTVLHLEHSVQTMKTRLRWPDDPTDTDTWREEWSKAFQVRHREVITTSKALAIRLAELAKVIRKKVNSALDSESEKGPLRTMMDSFKKALIHDLEEDDFADMYAQTIAYGLLTARISRPEGLVADNAADMVPVTNPFLKELLETFLKMGGRDRDGDNRGTGIDFDELGVNEVVQLLRDANMEAVLRDFGDRNPYEDPVIHFYELFLKEYDAKKRMQRGVFYTPRPVVSFIVRSVDELLRTEFGLEDGLADTTTWGEMGQRIDDFEIPNSADPEKPFVQILDPATGTGTFLVEVIGVIHTTMKKKWKSAGNSKTEIHDLWNDYVADSLLPRLHGFELLMAPYAIAHMKIGLKLIETGYDFKSSERARIYLSNSLEFITGHKQVSLKNILPALAKEATMVQNIMFNKLFTIIIANPPYAQMSANMSNSVKSMIDVYRYIDNLPISEKSALSLERNLNDDYIKFFRLSQLVTANIPNIIGYITNNSYLDALSLRGFRWNLISNCDRMMVVNLHGDADKKERTPEGKPDNNVFDIKKGVTINISYKLKSTTNEMLTLYKDIYGIRDDKYATLLKETATSLSLKVISPIRPNYIFDISDVSIDAEYNNYISCAELFNDFATGFTSGYDQLLTAFTKEELLDNIIKFSTLSDEIVTSEYRLTGVYAKDLFSRRKSMVTDNKLNGSIIKFLYAPFDIRYAYYNPEFVMTASYRVGKHLVEHDNIALMIMRQVSIGSYFTHALITNVLPNNRSFYSTKGKVAYLPQVLYYKQDVMGRIDNYTINNIKENVSIYYIYAILYSSKYRTRYDKQLRSDYPHIPITKSKVLYEKLETKGKELTNIHMLKKIDSLSSVSYENTSGASPRISSVLFKDNMIWIDKDKNISFSGISSKLWNYEIGGYPVCKKWLKDRGPKKGRPGRTLTDEDIEHYKKIIVAIQKTILIVGEIDEVIEEHGGWPNAFVID